MDDAPPPAGNTPWPAALAAASLLALPPGTRRRPELQPLLHAVLEREGRLGALSREERAFARRAYYATLARSRLFGETLLLLLEDAEREGARVLLLKGAFLAFAVYADPATRPMADLDLAVRPADLPRLARRLEARGYRRFGGGRRRFSLEISHHAIFEHPSRPLVELHLRLGHELGVASSIDEWFDHAIEVEALGRRWPAPSWDDQLLFVALHAASHGFAESPIWLADLAYLAPRTEGAGLRSAASRHAAAAAYFAVQLARRYLPHLALPHPAPPALAGPRALALRLLLGQDPLADRPGFLASLLIRAALTDGARELGLLLAGKTRLRIAEYLFRA